LNLFKSVAALCAAISIHRHGDLSLHKETTHITYCIGRTII
jgi:hypothetical protein